jgi:hypothetical protein
VDKSGATGTFPKLNFAGIKAGTYTFKYTTNTAIAPCVNQSYTVTVTVNDCKCLDVATSAPKTLCNDGGSVDLKTITVTTELGIWSITNAPIGTKPAIITGTTFDATGADAGEYTIGGLSEVFTTETESGKSGKCRSE